MTLSSIIQTKTDYLHLALRLTLAIALVGLTLYAVFPIGFWFMHGEDAVSNHIEQKTVYGLLYLYGPLLIIMTFIAWRYLVNKKKRDIQHLKSYLIISAIILTLYPFRYGIIEDAVEWIIRLTD